MINENSKSKILHGYRCQDEKPPMTLTFGFLFLLFCSQETYTYLTSHEKESAVQLCNIPYRFLIPLQ